MTKLKKMWQGTIPVGRILSIFTHSRSDTYCCTYLNGITEHHIGAVILTTDKDYSPAEQYGGTWERIAGEKYLMGYNPNNGWFDIPGSDRGSRNGPGNFNTDGTALTIDQMPSHGHAATLGLGWRTGGGDSVARVTANNGDWNGWPLTIHNAGGNQPHSHFHVLPYYTVCAWRRIA